MHLDSRLIHGDRETAGDGPITPAIAQGLNWAYATSAAFEDATTRPQDPRLYTRHGNENHEQAARLIAALEGAEAGVMTAAGMGAIATTVLSFVSAGDHVVCQRSMYGGVTSLALHLLPRLGVRVTQVDQGDTDAFAAAITPATRLVLLETPSNPLLEVTDLAAVAAIAREHGAITVADNTFATPIDQRPIEYGVDLVWHSATKYLAGHSDLMAGAVVGSREHVTRVWETLQVTGAVLAPFNAWLLLRGLRTLSLRVARHNANATALAAALDAHPAVARVHYPGLPGHRGHDVAARQMSGFGGVLSFELDGGFERADAFIDALSIVRRATSLGDVSSLIVHPAAMWAKSLSPQELADAGVAPGLVRLSCGIEDTDDLLQDVAAALSA